MSINNSNLFGAFTLNEIRASRLSGDWLNKETVANYGWFGGGQIPGPQNISSNIASVDRIDFSNDTLTAVARGSLSTVKYSMGVTGNSNYGWFGGGYIGPSTSTVERIDYTNDSPKPTIRGSLTNRKSSIPATGNSNYGWFGGGQIPGVGTISSLDRLDFSNDAILQISRGSLSTPRYSSNATQNSNYGWFIGGSSSVTSPGYTTAIERIDFSNDSTTGSQRGSLNIAKGDGGATGNTNYGWYGGGWRAVLPLTWYSTVERISFANDTATALTRAPLSVAKTYVAATGNSNYGWWGGGYGTAPPIGVYYATVERLDFANDSTAGSPRGALTQSKFSTTAISGNINSRLQKAGNYGWFAGGLSSVNTVYSTIDRIDFSNDIPTASPRSVLNIIGRQQLAATGNSNYGWFCGGLTPTGSRSYVDRIDFFNDSTVLTRGLLSATRYGLAATGNSNYGWFGGGSGPSPAALVDRINFSNDSIGASLRSGSLSFARYKLAATGNFNYGWFGGGTTGVPVFATVDRIDFSNDSATASPRSPLSLPRNELAATGNSNYGWFGGGTPGPVATVDRIDFSNDSVTASIRGPLSATRYGLAATGNSNYGWFGGGAGPLSTVNRINFSNDLVSASIRGSISTPAGRSRPAATSNTNK